MGELRYPVVRLVRRRRWTYRPELVDTERIRRIKQVENRAEQKRTAGKVTRHPADSRPALGRGGRIPVRAPRGIRLHARILAPSYTPVNRAT